MNGQGAQDALQSWSLVWGSGQGDRFAASLLEEFAVAERIGYVEAVVTGLAGAEKFARAANFEIGFGNFKTVGRADHGIEASLGFLGLTNGADQDAVRCCGTAADTSAKLVELS